MPKPSLFNPVETPLVGNDIIIVEKGSGGSAQGGVGYAKISELPLIGREALRFNIKEGVDAAPYVENYDNNRAGFTLGDPFPLESSENKRLYELNTTILLSPSFQGEEILSSIGDLEFTQFGVLPRRMTDEEIVSFEVDCFITNGIDQETTLSAKTTSVGYDIANTGDGNGAYFGTLPLCRTLIPTLVGDQNNPVDVKGVIVKIKALVYFAPSLNETDGGINGTITTTHNLQICLGIQGTGNTNQTINKIVSTFERLA